MELALTTSSILLKEDASCDLDPIVKTTPRHDLQVDNGGPFRSCKRRSDCGQLREEEGGDGGDGDCYRWPLVASAATLSNISILKAGFFGRICESETVSSVPISGTRTGGMCFQASASPSTRSPAASTTPTARPTCAAQTSSAGNRTTSGKRRRWRGGGNTSQGFHSQGTENISLRQTRSHILSGL